MTFREQFTRIRYELTDEAGVGVGAVHHLVTYLVGVGGAGLRPLPAGAGEEVLSGGADVLGPLP